MTILSSTIPVLSYLNIISIIFAGLTNLNNIASVHAFLPPQHYDYHHNQQHNSEKQKQNDIISLDGMKRPILDRIASGLFNLENKRVEKSSVVDDKGRTGEPMEWSKKQSLANRFSEMIASNQIGYTFKQTVANIVAGDYDEETTQNRILDFVDSNKVVMFSFTTCPFCRGAKDYLDVKGITYKTMELDELDGNVGNEIRASLGKITGRTSVPSIFICGTPIGGLNDGTPGLLRLGDSEELDVMLSKK